MSTGRFQELNTNIMYVIEQLYTSQNLLKLITYDDDSPLSISKSDIIKPSSLLFDRIYPLPKIPDAQTQQKTIVTVIFSHAKLDSNIKFKKYKLIFNIISHIDIWKISEGLRPYLIAEEIDNIFNELRGTQLSIGKVLFSDFVNVNYSNYYYGYQLVYDISSFN